jgi:hypothetical protein
MVDAKEQSIQGFTISLLLLCGMQNGDKIIVIPISKKMEEMYFPKPETKPGPAPVPELTPGILEKILDKFLPRIPMLDPDLWRPGNYNESPVFA